VRQPLLLDIVCYLRHQSKLVESQSVASGELYTVGLNLRGQLGLGMTSTITTPTLVRELADKRVVDVACSYFHTVVATPAGELFACGRNDFGQLGTGDTTDWFVPRPVNFFSRSLSARSVLAVACGQHHTVVALSSGGVVAFGKNDHGQLGLGHISDPVLEPSLLAPPLDTVVATQLSCGYHHTAAVTDGGEVYTFGRNDYGQLGLGHKKHMPSPAVSGASKALSLVDGD
jgi:alpha-tubulin suppressor-like RCC1 family protein